MRFSPGKQNNRELSEELCDDNGEFLSVFFIDRSQNLGLSR